METPPREEKEIYYTQEDLNTVWSILERIGVKKSSDIDLDELKSTFQKTDSPVLLTPWGEKVFNFASLEKLSIVFNVKTGKK